MDDKSAKLQSDRKNRLKGRWKRDRPNFVFQQDSSHLKIISFDTTRKRILPLYLPSPMEYAQKW